MTINSFFMIAPFDFITTSILALHVISETKTPFDASSTLSSVRPELTAEGRPKGGPGDLAFWAR